MKKQKLLIIGGPTGVGKTKLGIECAKLFDGEIISSDCIQIYKNLDIGSAKPTKEEQSLAKHHLIDIASPFDNFSVSDFREKAKKIILNLKAENKLPIIVGGTGLYINSLLFPYEYGHSEKNEEVREKYKKLAAQKGNEAVFEILKQVDKESADKLHPNDLKRVIRALEIYETTGKKKSSQVLEKNSEFDYLLIFLNTDRAVLYERINKRIEQMFSQGLIDEVKSLINLGLTRENQSMQAIGYKEFFDYFEGKIDLQTLIEQIKQNSRNYAKRQITWFKNQKDVIEADIKNMDEIIHKIKSWLNK